MAANQGRPILRIHGTSSSIPERALAQVDRRGYGVLVRESQGKVAERSPLRMIYAAEKSAQMTGHGYQRHG